MDGDFRKENFTPLRETKRPRKVSKTYKEWVIWRKEYFKYNNSYRCNPEMNSQEKQKIKDNCKTLLDDIILTAQEQDEAHKIASIRAGKGSQAIGESWMVFHLKALKDNLNEVF